MGEGKLSFTRTKKGGGGRGDEKVLAILKGGAKCFHPLKGVTQKVLPCLGGGGGGRANDQSLIFINISIHLNSSYFSAYYLFLIDVNHPWNAF